MEGAGFMDATKDYKMNHRVKSGSPTVFLTICLLCQPVKWLWISAAEQWDSLERARIRLV
jgi:hypothetical protein